MRHRLCKARQVRVPLPVVICTLPFTCACVTVASLSLAPIVFPFGDRTLLMISMRSPLAYVCGTAVESSNSSIGSVWSFSASSLALVSLRCCRVKASWIFNSCSHLIRLSMDYSLFVFKK